MLRIALMLLLVPLAGWAQGPASVASDTALHPAAAQSAAWSSATQRKLQELSEDFDAVVAGRKPIHALVDAKAPLPADGGTTFYVGDGYKLTIEQSLCSIGGAKGMLYGPVIVLGPELANGNDNCISHVTFYRMEEFRQLKHLAP